MISHVVESMDQQMRIYRALIVHRAYVLYAYNVLA